MEFIDNFGFFKSKSEYKSVNPTYTTFKGGYGAWNDDMTYWQYHFLWGYLSFTYDKEKLEDDWVWISLHGYKNGYTYTPVKLKWWNFDWNMAYRKKWPFIKIGFDNIIGLISDK